MSIYRVECFFFVSPLIYTYMCSFDFVILLIRWDLKLIRLLMKGILRVHAFFLLFGASRGIFKRQFQRNNSEKVKLFPCLCLWHTRSCSSRQSHRNPASKYESWTPNELKCKSTHIYTRKAHICILGKWRERGHSIVVCLKKNLSRLLELVINYFVECFRMAHIQLHTHTHTTYSQQSSAIWCIYILTAALSIEFCVLNFVYFDCYLPLGYQMLCFATIPIRHN